jgi:DNA replication protein DnaC
MMFQFAKLDTAAKFYRDHGAGNDYNHVWEAVKKFLRGHSQGLFFTGPNGSGKSYVACATLNTLHEFGYSIRRATVFELMEHYKENEWRIPQMYFEVDVLLLEELGKHSDFKTDITTPVVEQLIKSRVENKKFTCYTANAGVSDIEKLHGATVVSMIKGATIPVAFPNRDWRVILNKQRIEV